MHERASVIEDLGAGERKGEEGRTLVVLDVVHSGLSPGSLVMGEPSPFASLTTWPSGWQAAAAA